MKKIISAAVLICVILVILLEPMSLAWMSDNGLSSPIDIKSNVHKSYFESGNGTKELIKDDDGEIISGPYEIAHPIQLYYFAWLQYLGYFNQDNNDDGKVDTVYFRLSRDIDMKEDGVQFVLPPIGSADNPFLGSFDGEGNTIKNLVVQNVDEGITEAPTTGGIAGVEIVGFFGVIGALAGDYSEANEVKNFVLENLTVKTQTQSALIGLVAGYVNGLVDCVGVVGSTVDIKSGTTALSYTNNISDYSLIGYCTGEFKKDMVCVDLDMLSPDVNIYEVVPDNTSGGPGQGWGGSIAMDDMFTFVQSMMSSAARNTSYVYAKSFITTLNKENALLSTGTTEKKVIYNKTLGAAFVFSPRSSGSYSTQYTYLSGGLKITDYTYGYSDKDVTQYYITDGTYYLNYNGTAISSTANRANATKWYASEGTGGGTLYTVINGTVYYLTISNNSITTIRDTQADPANLPSWSVKYSAILLGSQAIECDNGTWRVVAPDLYLISSGTHYLTANGTTGLKDEDEDGATKWTVNINGNTATISTLVNGTPYYVGATATSNSNATLTLSTTRTNWTYDASNGRFYVSIRYNRQNRTYYIRYNNGWVGITGSTNYEDLTLTGAFSDLGSSSITSAGTTAKEIVVTSREHVDNTIVQNGNTIETGVTYFPLSVNKNGNTYSTATGNTGYIISSSYSDETSVTHPYGTADIRVSRYETDGRLNNYEKPYTISYKTKNNNGNYAFQQISTATAEQYGMVKFNDCFEDYTDSIGTNCYGLHFMQASIDINSIVTAEKVQIIGESYSNYQLPTNCIDFNLAEQGFINFVAGTYFADNDSFFSLHKIERDKDRNIIAIKEIDKIYGYIKSDGNLDPNKQYYYTYVNASSDEGMPSGTGSDGGAYQIIFDTEWIKNPNSYGHDINETNHTYYFEVPVYGGEYALGSAGDDKIGAYLIYLDLAANAQVVERTRVDEKTVTEEREVSLPNGVSMLEKNDAGYTTENITSEDSAFASIGAGFSGSASFSQSGTTITDSAKGHTATYVADGVALVGGDGSSMTVPVTKTVTVEKTTYRDVNLVTKEQTVTVIVKTTETVGSQTNVSYTKNVTKTAADGTVTSTPEQTSTSELLPDVPDPETNPPVVEMGESLINVSYLVTDASKFKVETSYTPEGEDENGNATAPVYTISATNTTAAAIDITATLTAEGVSSGVTFVITDGTTTTTLNANTNEQTVTIGVTETV